MKTAFVIAFAGAFLIGVGLWLLVMIRRLMRSGGPPSNAGTSHRLRDFIFGPTHDGWYTGPRGGESRDDLGAFGDGGFDAVDFGGDGGDDGD